MKWWKWLLLVILMLSVALAALAPTMGYVRFTAKVRFREAAVIVGRVERAVNSTGTIKPVRSVSIGAFVSGPVAELFVDFNSVVKKGDLLARIDPRLLSANVDRDRAGLAIQEAELARIQAELTQAKRNEERAKKLREIREDYIADTEIDQFYFARLALEARLKLAEAGIDQSKASLKNAEANLGYTKIISPVDGIVTERKIDLGQTVAASFQTPELFIVAPDMDKFMHVFANVDEADIGLIRKAQETMQPVRFTVDAYPDEIFEGKILDIRKSSSTTQNVVTYPVIVETPNPGMKLMPGMTANLSFQIESRENVLCLPASALRFIPDKKLVDETDLEIVEKQLTLGDPNQPKPTATEKVERAKQRSERNVWVRAGEKVKPVKVKLGLVDNQFAEVLSDELKVGQSLVIGVISSGPQGGTR